MIIIIIIKKKKDKIKNKNIIYIKYYTYKQKNYHTNKYFKKTNQFKN